jgi:hypothetical protein
MVTCAKNFTQRPVAEALFAKLGRATHEALLRNAPAPALKATVAAPVTAGD